MWLRQHHFHSLTNRAVTVQSKRRIGKEGRFVGYANTRDFDVSRSES